MKICSRCKQTREFSRFQRDSSCRDDYAPVCKDCRNFAERERRRTDPQYRLHRKKQQKKDIASGKFLNWTRKSLYGVTPGAYQKLFSGQSGKCAVCLVEKKLVIDHNHKTGEVRGLLCHRCNLLLGVWEGALTLKQALDGYLLNPPAPKI